MKTSVPAVRRHLVPGDRAPAAIRRPNRRELVPQLSLAYCRAAPSPPSWQDLQMPKPLPRIFMKRQVSVKL